MINVLYTVYDHTKSNIKLYQLYVGYLTMSSLLYKLYEELVIRRFASVVPISIGSFNFDDRFCVPVP